MQRGTVVVISPPSVNGDTKMPVPESSAAPLSIPEAGATSPFEPVGLEPHAPISTSAPNASNGESTRTTCFGSTVEGESSIGHIHYYFAIPFYMRRPQIDGSSWAGDPRSRESDSRSVCRETVDPDPSD